MLFIYPMSTRCLNFNYHIRIKQILLKLAFIKCQSSYHASSVRGDDANIVVSYPDVCRINYKCEPHSEQVPNGTWGIVAELVHNEFDGDTTVAWDIRGISRTLE